MKNKFLIILALIAFFGCEEQLDRSPIDALRASTTFQSVGDLENGMFGFIGSYGINTLTGFNSLYSDNTTLGSNNGGQELNALQLILDPDTGDRGLWANRYSHINDINRVLEAAETIEPDPNTPGEVDTYNFILGQARGFRALAHWDLLLYYGLDVTDPSAPGVVYQDFVELNGNPSRLTVGETLAAIQADLDLANEILEGETDKSYITPDFITFLRARIALETGDYDGAIANATAIIDQYPLANQAQYLEMFGGDLNDIEVVWRYDSVQGFNATATFIWHFGGGTLLDADFVKMSSELAGLFQVDDVRFTVNLENEVDIEADSELITKYPPNANQLYINDVKAMRSSEAYLIRAEAHARNGAFDLAAADVESVRDARRAGTITVEPYESTVEAIEDILFERRLELCFEGHRYNDIKRTRDITGEGMSRADADCAPASVNCEIPVDSEKWIFPIPTEELNANPNILPQAPGY
ncbi:MAG: RagB/SusD family nutrient uptake outer membrane protein [Bacteroidota bacterium]